MFLFEMTAKLFWTVVGSSIGVLVTIGVLLILGLIYLCVMEWADDNEKEYNNPMWSLILKIFGLYRIKNVPHSDGYGTDYTDGFTSNKKYEGCSYKDLPVSTGEKIITYHDGDLVASMFAVVFICPLALLVALWIYPVTLTCLTLLALAHLLRFCKRLAKKFTKHTVDPNAHKKGAEQ